MGYQNEGSDGVSERNGFTMRKSNLELAALLLVLISVAFNAIGQTLFKFARSAQPDVPLFSILLHPKIWAGFII